MATSSAASRSQSRLLMVIAAAALLIGAVAVVGIVVFRSVSGETVVLQSVAEPARSPQTDPAAVGEPSGEGTEEVAASSGSSNDEGPVATQPTGQSQGTTTDAVAAAYDDLWELGQHYIGGNDPVGVIAVLSDQVGSFPVTDDAALASFGLDVDREERDRTLRIQYRTAIRYYSQHSVEEVIDLYRTDVPLLDLPEREFESGSDDDGDYIDIDFGSFSDHPDPLIWWANLSLQVRSDDKGTLVRIYYTVTRTDAAETTGLLASIEAGLPLADGYEKTSVAVSGFSIDPYEKPTTFSVNLVATATLAEVTANESDELSRLADVASTTGNWILDEQTESGVWMNSAQADDLRNYLTLRLTDAETVARYSYS